jgi:hypothetical protein
MMSNQTDNTESVSHHSVLAIEVCPFTDSGQFTHGTGTSSVEPSSTYALVPNGASPEWDWQWVSGPSRVDHRANVPTLVFISAFARSTSSRSRLNLHPDSLGEDGLLNPRLDYG